MSYVRKAELKTIEHMVGGPGHVLNRSLIEGPETLFNSGRLFAHNVLEKDCGIGFHTHTDECELYYMLKGEAEYNDNGQVRTISAGDITYTGPGESHSLINRKDEPVEVIALILFSEQKKD